MELTFQAIDEARPGQKWRGLFAALWPAYRAWYLRRGVEERPTYLACRTALKRHMPEMTGLYDGLCDEAGGGDIEARFLSLYCPPAYLSGCSQAIWPGGTPFLVRNYDYSPTAFDAVLLRTSWLGKRVAGMSDCLIGLTDGINEDGLTVSLTFGGRQVVGRGFGVPIILRYVLETCATTPEAVKALSRIPCHMAYNVTVLDVAGRSATLYLAPDRAPDVTSATVATNHQRKVEWMSHAYATGSVERERLLLQKLSKHRPGREEFISAFLKPPLYSIGYERGFGTLFTAIYTPEGRGIELRWPGLSWHQPLDNFSEGVRIISYETQDGPHHAGPANMIDDRLHSLP